MLFLGSFRHMPNQIALECLIAERGVTVIRNGLCELSD